MSEQKQTMRDRLLALWQELQRKRLGILTGALLSAGIGYVLLSTGAGDSLVHQSYDKFFYFRPFIHPKEAVMVFLDDASHDQLHQKYLEPWDRSYHTRLIKRLTAEKAKAIVFDIVFSDLLDPNKDQALIQAIQENGNVVLAADWVTENFGGERTNGWSKPNPAFDLVAGGVGSTTLDPDEDVMVRRYFPHGLDNVKDKDGNLQKMLYPSEAWVAGQVIGANLNTNIEFEQIWLNYYAPEDKMLSVSLYKVLAEHDPDVPPGYFSNKVVFVGSRLQTQTSAARKDEYPSPFSYLQQNKFIPGVAIHATAYLNLVRGDWLRRLASVKERAIIILVGIVFGFGLIMCKPLHATIISLVAVIPIVLFVYFCFVHFNYWFPWMIVLAQILLALIFSVAFNSIQLLLEKARVEQSLSMYLSPKLVKKFASDPSLLKPGAKKQMLTILFSDIAGFTTISEGMDSDELAHLMNKYFQVAVSNCVHSTDGTVVKYIGDAIFAFWNAPDPQPDHALRACHGALRFQNQEAQVINGQELITRIGLHTGLANVGNFGSDTRVDYTAISENINLASRMEGLNKYLGTIVLITGETQKEVKDQVITRYLGLFILKGFEKSVQVYELVGLPAEEGQTQLLRDSFGAALKKFQAGDFAGAKEGFLNTQKINAEDGPCKFYLDHLEEMGAEELPEDWKGEVKLKDK